MQSNGGGGTEFTESMFCFLSPHHLGVTPICGEFSLVVGLWECEAPAELCLSINPARQEPRTPFLDNRPRHNQALHTLSIARAPAFVRTTERRYTQRTILGP
jgi:hypothetical protein